MKYKNLRIVFNGNVKNSVLSINPGMVIIKESPFGLWFLGYPA